MRKIWWIFTILTVVFVLTLLVLYWYLPLKIDQKIHQVITDNGLDIQYEHLNVNILKGNLSFHNAKAVFPYKNGPYGFKLQQSVSNILIEGLNWRDLQKKQQFSAKTIQLEQPDIHLLVDKSPTNLADTLSQQTAHNDSSVFLIEVDLLQINHGYFQLHYPQDTAVDFSIDTINFQIHQLAFNANEALTPEIVSHFNFNFQCFSSLDRKSVHRINIGKMVGNSRDSSLQVGQIEFVPLYSKKDFSSHVAKKAPRMDISLPYVLAEGLDYQKLFSNNFQAHRITVPYPDFRSYTDKNVPEKLPAYNKLPNRIFAELETKVSIDTILIQDGYIWYAELFPEKSRPGYLDFHDLNAVFTNVTNDSILWKSNNVIDVRINSQFYGAAPLYLNLQFPMQAQPWTYYYQGDLRRFDMRLANDMMTQAAAIQFKSGYVDELSFQTTANPKVATGELEFYYKNLDVEFSKEDKGAAKIAINDLMEWVLFPQENIKNEKHRIGQMYFQRDTQRSFFNYFWKTIFSGMKSTFMPNIMLPKELKHKKKKPPK